MKQTRLIALALLTVGAIAVGVNAPPASARETSFIYATLEGDLVKNISDVAKQNIERVESRADEARTAAEHASRSLTRNDTNASENRPAKSYENKSENANEHAQHSQRFNADKTRKCEAREDKIGDKLDVISNRGSKQLSVFHTIAKRVQDFYVAKHYSVAGYEQLSAELDALYDQSLVALTATQNANDAWGCLMNDPIASLENFKATKRAEMATTAAYKEKVRELILLVKRAGGEK